MEKPSVWNVVYVTSSSFKVQENEVFTRTCYLSDGIVVGDRFSFDIREVSIKESLEVDLREMVSVEVGKAYEQLRIPCIVEHAGLIFDDYRERSYPGGLTKAMWNALNDDFITETNSAGRRATARAVVAYCDGERIETFVGETPGMIAPEPRGSRQFYWDTVFIPDVLDDSATGAAGLTYAQIVDHPDYGLEYKMAKLSQSAKAMIRLLEHLLAIGPPPLWGRFP